MRRLRFGVQSKPEPPKVKYSPKKSPFKVQDTKKGKVDDPIPVPSIDQFLNKKEKEQNDSIDSDVVEEEDIGEEINELDGLTHEELVELYEKEKNSYLSNITKVTNIIHSKMTSI